MIINTFQYRPEGMDCTHCAMYGGKKQGCTAKVCPWLAERIEAGLVGYKEAVMETFPHDAHLSARLHTAISHFSGSLFDGPDHRKRMEEMEARQDGRSKREVPAHLAAMYLLTANEDIYSRTINCICEHCIEFSRAVKQGISPHNYTLLSAARDIYEDAAGIMLNDLACADVVDTLAFSLIVNALLVVRYGCAVLKISDREGKA